MVNTFIVIFLNQKVGSIINLIRKSLYRSCLQHFELLKKKKFNPSTKEVKGIKINLDFIFNNFNAQVCD